MLELELALELAPKLEMTAATEPERLETAAEPDLELELALELEPAPEIEQALPDAAPRLLLPPSRTKHPALHELSWLALQLLPLE